MHDFGSYSNRALSVLPAFRVIARRSRTSSVILGMPAFS